MPPVNQAVTVESAPATFCHVLSDRMSERQTAPIALQGACTYTGCVQEKITSIRCLRTLRMGSGAKLIQHPTTTITNVHASKKSKSEANSSASQCDKRTLRYSNQNNQPTAPTRKRCNGMIDRLLIVNEIFMNSKRTRLLCHFSIRLTPTGRPKSFKKLEIYSPVRNCRRPMLI